MAAEPQSNPVTTAAGMREAPGGKSAAGALRDYCVALLACAITTLVATPLRDWFDPANLIMLFLLEVVVVALWLGRGPAVMASFVSVAAFDFFFVPPRFSFTVDDPQYLVTFSAMLAVALIISQLAAGLKRQANAARMKEQRSHALYEMARELTGASTLARVIEISRRFLRAAVDVEAAFLLPDESGRLEPAANGDSQLRNFAPLMVRLAYENTACTDLDAPHPVGYFPLKAPAGVRGVLAVASPGKSAKPLYEHQEFMQTAASLIAIAIERLHYASNAGEA